MSERKSRAVGTMSPHSRLIEPPRCKMGPPITKWMNPFSQDTPAHLCLLAPVGKQVCHWQVGTYTPLLLRPCESVCVEFCLKKPTPVSPEYLDDGDGFICPFAQYLSI